MPVSSSKLPRGPQVKDLPSSTEVKLEEPRLEKLKGKSVGSIQGKKKATQTPRRKVSKALSSPKAEVGVKELPPLSVPIEQPDYIDVTGSSNSSFVLISPFRFF